MARKRAPRRSSRTLLGEPTKKDFEAMAGILCRRNADPELVHDIANYFGRQNPRFSADRFVAATRKC
jgi:hypothetical protein